MMQFTSKQPPTNLRNDHEQPSNNYQSIDSMANNNQPPEESYDELTSLRQEVTKLRNELAGYQAQKVLLESLVTMAKKPSEGGVLRAALQTTLDISADLSGSEKGSLFILDPSGKVVDAILARAEVTEKQRAKLLGMVLDNGLAGWVSRNRQLALITDTDHDQRWINMPDQPYVARSVLAVPILRGSELLGILTLQHSEPERFNQQIADCMETTADQIAVVLENAELYTKLDAYSQALDKELEKGRQIQKDFLPYDIPQLPDWEISAVFHPARQVAGDFYDAFELPDGSLGLVIADVCDKGVGAALFMALFRSLIRIFSVETKLHGEASTLLKEYQPQNGWLSSQVASLAHINALQAVTLTNEYVAQQHWQMSMFATLFFGVLEPTTGILTYISGGHEPLYVIGDSGIKATLDSTGPAVGMMPNMKFKIEQIQLEKGDILIGYTDGVTEAKSPEGELFTNQRLTELLTKQADSGSALLGQITDTLFNYIDDAAQFDDITMLALYRRYTTG